ncbi:MAG TPA: C1 family peptidase [Fimbriimonadaceae bacterium]|nr:C1 family peptidase [Fimbriimonadaceae bacterium]
MASSTSAKSIVADLGAISAADLKRYQKAFDASPRNRLSMNAVTASPLAKVALNRDTVSRLDRSFSVHLPENKATAQMSSGRCWLFAALNTFRVRAIETMNLGDDFELSQAYVCFWDKLEKANYFLENILATAHEPVGSRILDHLLQSPIQDGGQWHMFLNLVQKYGVVPKSAMPETDSSSNTGAMNNQVTARLRAFAKTLREASATSNGKSGSEKARKLKDEMVSEIYRMLAIHLGEPPREFDWQWRDKDRNFHRAGKLTPNAFYDKYVGLNLDDLVCLIHDPRPIHKYDEVYTVQMLGNVVGGTPILYLNVDLPTMKEAAIAQLQAGDPVWFGCDVGKFLDRDMGVMDTALFDYDLVYGRDGTGDLDKAGRLMYGQSLMTHAMVFTGVNLDEKGQPTKWRVENSWSDKPGDKGFFQMSDPWFDEYNYEVVVHKSHVAKKSLEALKRKPVELPPWDPMGSLAV